ncbi:WYL domain-containing protein [Acinetobacter sp. UBA3106]|uniref:WYL domain-containing protein n=1 Tax=Acinetobacter sp. UBA3106 TaxID=1945936 RepID=UPI0025C493C8|nr:WYL domain-containing protein [Acinetobacter sp. UBA3106]
MQKQTQNSLITRLIALYKTLPRFPKSALPIEQLKEYVRSYYSDQIDEQSLTKAIRRDLELLPELLVSGSLENRDGKGNQPRKYLLSQDAWIEPLNSELALVLVMANEYLNQQLPDEIYSKVEGFFRSAELQLQSDTKLKNWNSRFRFVPDGYAQIQKTEHHTEIQKIIYQALLEGNVWLQGNYRKEGTQITENYLLKPQGVIQYGQKPYLIASKITENKTLLRTFNILHFENLKIVPEKISIDVEIYDLEGLVENREFEYALFNREEQDIFFVFEEELLDELNLNPIGDFQTIKKIDEGYYELRASCVLTNSRMDWLTEKAEYLQIVAPDCLFEEIQFRITKAGEKHQIFNEFNSYGL